MSPITQSMLRDEIDLYEYATLCLAAYRLLVAARSCFTLRYAPTVFDY